MADGDVQFKILHKQTIGGGKNASGVSKPKALVIGEITGTYVSTGCAVNKLGGDTAFGVDNIDFLKLNPILIASAYPTAEKLFKADYDVTNKKIFLLEDVGATNAAPPSDADAITIRYVAIGDDAAAAPELT